MPCDASGMAEIHRVFRHGFGEGPDLVGRVAEGGAAHARTVARHLATLSTSLHSHHEFEDGHLWDPLVERAPACVLHVDRMRRQHAEMLVHLQALDAALPVWTAAGRAEHTGVILAAQLDGGTAWMRKQMPAPGRAMWRLVGRRRYDTDRRTVLHGPRGG